MSRLFKIASDAVNADSKYTDKVAVPQYLPSSVAPPIESLCDFTKYSKLIADINSSTVSESEKKFLRMAASRHIVFNYSKIADYYAHATPEMQELMEQSALVILDIDDAIANGYVKLTKDIERIMLRTGEPTNAG